MLMAIMEVVLPGNRFVSIRSTDQLEKVANIKIPEEDRADMQSVIDTYPVRLSMHTIRQMRVSKNVAYQYLPFTEELDAAGHTNSINECVNGILKSFLLNRQSFRNLETLQAYLDLFVLWHNTRVIQRGKRQGKSPFQIAGIQTDSPDWLTLLGF